MATKRKVCFFICPMGDPESETRRRSLELREKIVQPAMRSLDFDLEDFLDDLGSRESIRQRMMLLIQSADLCIADLTENNPNVFFEYGLRRATGRPVLAFIHEGQKLVYDVDDYYTEPYDFGNPSGAIDAIENFAQRTGLGRPTLQVDAQRTAQTKALCHFIVEKRPRRVDILQVSLVAMRESLFPALWKSPETIVRVLLLHPDYAVKRYGGLCRDDVLETAKLVKNLPDRTRKFAPRPTPPCPTVGLWYYKYEPGVSAVIVDDKLLQLGWYLREPSPTPEEEMCVKGSTQPGLLAWDKDALTLIEPIRDHFLTVLHAAEWVLGVGDRQEELQGGQIPHPATTQDAGR
jgi:hypothetical protein